MKDFITKLSYGLILAAGVSLYAKGQHFWGAIFLGLYSSLMFDRSKS